MSDQDYAEYDDEPMTERSAGGPGLPGGISLQAAAAILLIAVLMAVLYLFFGPVPDEGEADPEATATPVTLSTAGVTAGASTAPAGAGSDRAVAPTPIAPPSGTAESDVASSSGADTGGGESAGATVPAGSSDGAGAGTPVPPSDTTQLGARPSPNGFVRVANTDGYGLRFRFGYGLDTATIRVVEEGESLRVMGEPVEDGGAWWWRLQDAFGNVGWASEEFLQPVAAPLDWNPPAASPTFPAPAVEDAP